jgi:hypothetical protein
MVELKGESARNVLELKYHRKYASKIYVTKITDSILIWVPARSSGSAETGPADLGTPAGNASRIDISPQTLTL